jgi:hypothetical protein
LEQEKNVAIKEAKNFYVFLLTNSSNHKPLSLTDNTKYLNSNYLFKQQIRAYFVENFKNLFFKQEW